MIPDARTVLRRRFTVLVVLRLAALAIAAVGVIDLGIHTTDLTRTNIGFDMWEYRGALMAAAGIFGLPAAALAIFSTKLAAWIVPAPRAGCPRCGYAVASIDSGTCPECGTKFGTDS